MMKHLSDETGASPDGDAPDAIAAMVRAGAARRELVEIGAIAIVGMAGRFPGAPDVARLWGNFRDGVDSISHFAPDEIDDSFDPAVRADPTYVPARPVLPDVDRFDAGFFGMHSREAALTDPQHRLFLECAWEGLEDAGCDPARFEGGIGVFGGCSMNTYLLRHVCADRSVIENFTNEFQVGQYAMLTGAGHDFLATRVAYKLDLRGPAMSVASACSTSLLAVAQAMQSLQTWQCDMAIAGGSSISFPQHRGYMYQDGGMTSPDGRCRPFDAEAGGTVFGSGVGLVVLKRYEDAIAAGDRIHAVLRAAAVNNDGAGKIGFTTPSIDGQAAVIAMAHQLAGVSADSIGYVEAHGTATPLGDPIEFAGLEKAFRQTTDRASFCALGSAKANVGHLDAAAGVTGLIRAALALREQQLPPLLHYRAPNPAIALPASPFYINAALQPWPQGETPRRAGCSAFGVGGTNVHVVLEEAPDVTPPATAIAAMEAAAPCLFPVSARDGAALAGNASALADCAARPDAPSLADMAHTLQSGRRAFGARLAVVARSHDELSRKLRAAADLAAAGGKRAAATPAGGRPIVFMFPGQGAQTVNMGRALYDTEPLFRDLIDEGAACVEEIIGQDLRALLYPAPGALDEGVAALQEQLNDTAMAQPALYLVEYAAARLLMQWGVRPDALVGHSLGEFTAAALAGVFSFTDGARIVAGRGRLMAAQPSGAMLSVRLAADALKALAPDGVEIAAVNARELTVATGPHVAIDALVQLLADRDIPSQRLRTSHAFHSIMMQPAADALAVVMAGIALAPPQIPCVSCLAGDWLDADNACNPAWWGRQCREPVQFGATLDTLATLEAPVLVEVGPGRSLATFARQQLRGRADLTVASAMPSGEDAAEAIRACIGELWRAGVEPDWAALTGPGARKCTLPTYAFQRARHWIDAPPPVAGMAQASTEMASPEMAAPVTAPAIAAATALDPTISTDASISADASWSNTVMASPEMTAAVQQPHAAGAAGDAMELAIIAVLEDLSGDPVDPGDRHASFLELGFDSLFLAQVATRVQQSFGAPLTFRQLLGDLPTIAALASYLREHAPADRQPQAAPAPVMPAAVPAAIAGTAAPMAPASAPALQQAASFAVAPVAMASFSGDVAGVMHQQLQVMQQLMAQQLSLLQGGTAAPSTLQPVLAHPAPVAPTPLADAPAITPAPAPAPVPQAEATSNLSGDSGSRFQVYRPPSAAVDAITPAQHRFMDGLASSWSNKAKGSKAYTGGHRGTLADPRAAAGFRAEWKEAVFPIVCARSKGAWIEDVDGNRYVDLVNGYGQTMFGHAPDFVMDAVTQQMAAGFAIGPQSPLAGEVADLIAEMTGNERVTFCNTGSEAVMAAMRIARTVTGRDRVVMFSGGYHGQFDEVLVKGGSRTAPPRALPVAPGIPRGSVGNMIVLAHGAPDSVAWVRANADSLAAVIVEPVQSRHPGLQPVEFLRELRDITAASGAALVFDEVVTGFRTHPGGMQARYDIRADLATYGKVCGGGLPIGVLAGKARFMDALDGGQWRYGDASVPEVAPTFFAGTFVRHPLVLAATRAVLLHLKAAGPALQEQLERRTSALVDRINADLARRGLRTRAETFSSWFYINFNEEDRLGPLFFQQARLLGLHIQDGFPAFVTTSHGDAEIDAIVDIFARSLDALQAVGILPGDRAGKVETPAAAVAPVVPEPLPPAVTPTEPQREVWLAAQAGDDASCAFNESVTLRFEGAVDPELLQQALDIVSGRHDALRGHFDRSGEQFHVADKMDLELARIEIAAGDADAALAEVIASDAATPFDLTAGPLARATLVQMTPASSALVFTAHHIVCDGWSMNVILDELAQVYGALRQGRQADLPAPLPFRRYARDQAATDRTKTRDWWLAQFRSLPADADLPSDRPRADRKDWAGATFRAHIPGDLLKQVKKAGARQGATLFSTLASAFNVVLWRLTGETDQVIAVPTAGQSLTEGGPLVGHCVNFLPLRTQVTPDAPVGDLLKAVQKAMLDLNEHQDYTFGALVRELGVARNPSRLPLTQVQFNLERLGDDLRFGEAVAHVAPNAKAFTNFDVFLNVIEGPDGLRLDCDYSTGLFDEATIARWIGHFGEALRAIAADAAQPVKAVRLLDDATVDLLANGLNATKQGGLDLRPVPLMLADIAARNPDAVALVWRDQAMTYGQLHASTEALARRIAAVAPGGGGRIGVLVERSPAMVVAMLAVMRAGHAFTPLDPLHPQARLEQVVQAARISALVSDDPVRAACAGGAPLVDVRAGAAPDADAADLPDCASAPAAYVIFTSGSTGAPKGVEIGHAALANLLWSFVERPGFTAADSMLAVTTTTFDIAMLELFMPLITGGRVVIADRHAVQDGFALARLIAEKRPSHIQATPSLWRMLCEAGFAPWPGLVMLCGGEPLPRDLALQLAGGEGMLWNVYGPTETTIWSSAGQVWPQDELITIGEPVLNTGLYVIDASGQLALPGAAGELAIGGLGLANGYFGQPDLTAAAFRQHTLDDGVARQLYFTGDMARRLADGRIQHLGRRDLQIKLRGFRIELEDIESALRAIPGVTDAAAGVTGAEPDRRLAAWVVFEQGVTHDDDALRRQARATLPDYMVPAIWTALDALPLTANGKLNRKALPEPEPAHRAARSAVATATARDLKEPRNDTEATLRDIWKEVLGSDDIGVDDNLFALGADSIHVFRIASRMLARGLNLEARDLMQRQTIAELAVAAAEKAATDDGGSRPASPSLNSFRRAGAARPGGTRLQ